MERVDGSEGTSMSTMMDRRLPNVGIPDKGRRFKVGLSGRGGTASASMCIFAEVRTSGLVGRSNDHDITRSSAKAWHPRNEKSH